MTDLRQRIAALSPQHRKLLSERLGLGGVSFRHVDRNADQPLSLGQQRLWATQAAAPGVPVDVVCQIVGIKGGLDRALLGAALEELVRRHETFRTTFHEAGSQIVQRVHPTGKPIWDPRRYFEMGGSSVAEREAQLHTSARALAWEPFDFANGPLVRTSLIKLGADEHALLFVAHNLCFDAWSFVVLLEELDDIYAELRAGKTLAGVAAGHQFVDFVDWQQRFLQSAEGRRKQHEWAGLLQAAPARMLPQGTGARDATPFAGERIDFKFPIELRERLVEIGKRAGGTLFMTLTAALQATLGSLSGLEDVVIGTLNANRGRREVERALGFFLNVVPIRTSLGDGPTFSSLLKRARVSALDSQARADIPYEAIQRAAHGDAAGDAPLFDVLFSFENLAKGAGSRSGLTFSTKDVDKRTARFDLTVSVYDEPNAFHGWVEYAKHKVSAERAQELVRRFQDTAMALAENPEASVALRGLRQ